MMYVVVNVLNDYKEVYRGTWESCQTRLENLNAMSDDDSSYDILPADDYDLEDHGLTEDSIESDDCEILIF